MLMYTLSIICLLPKQAQVPVPKNVGCNATVIVGHYLPCIGNTFHTVFLYNVQIFLFYIIMY